MKITTFTCLLALVVHLVYLFAILDVYYRSPLVLDIGVQFAPNVSTPLAKRLVLFVADGLRAHAFYDLDEETGAPLTPFLCNIARSKGRYGVAQTRVPTESRPGHVALIAGFYEDVSAVTKGWQENPVEFDSVFNQSTETWSWGSPDILPMFAKGAVGNHVHTFTYHGQKEDFASKDASKLDTWVFDSVKEFFQSAASNATLSSALRQHDGNVLFLHLLGIDTNGHGYKPHSREYLNNIRLVDSGVEEIYSLMERFFDDKRTAYVFTADHGMTDWGSHGTGHDHETMTPLVTWGSGLASSSDISVMDSQLKAPESASGITPWNDVTMLPMFFDVEQADVAALMTAVLAQNFPLHSVGRTPLSLINASDEDKYQIIRANFDQIFAQFDAKRRISLRSVIPRLLFGEFSELSSDKVESLERQVAALLDRRLYADAARLLYDTVPMLLRGFTYYHEYERPILSALIIGGYLVWIYVMLLLSSLVSPTECSQNQNDREIRLSELIRSTSIVGMLGYLFAAIVIYWLLCLSVTAIAYTVLPVLLCLIARYIGSLPPAANISVPQRSRLSWRHIGVCLAVCFLSSHLLVWVFFYRWLLSPIMILVGFWPFIEFALLRCKTLFPMNLMTAVWLLICLCVAGFPILKPVGVTTQFWLVAGSVISVGLIVGTVAIIISATTGINRRITHDIDTQTCSLGLLLAFFLCCSGVIIFSTHESLAGKRGLSGLNQALTWALFLASPLVPLLSGPNFVQRSLLIGLAFYIPYSLLCISYEILFYPLLGTLLIAWIWMENSLRAGHISNQADQKGFSQSVSGFKAHDDWTLESSDAGFRNAVRHCRRGCFLVFWTFLAFFGTGNIASLNSFNPSAIQCFVTVFQPFVMSTLLFFKVILPFVLVAVSLKALELTTRQSVGETFLVVLIVCDFMAAQFFLLLKDKGSWLDIGTSISHYVIAMVTTVVLIILYAFAEFYTSASILPLKRKPKTHLP